MSLTILAEATP